MSDGGVDFRVWASKAERVELEVVEPLAACFSMTADARGYWSVRVSEARAGWRYRYRINGEHSFPDPASRSQPEGVHAASEVISSDFEWHDQQWSGRALNDLVIYELHVGTFSSAGTFDGVIAQLDRLHELGINAIELMPLAQFPGDRNWGYDGVYPFAVQASYGGANGLRRLVDECHQRGIAVLLDVVFNHLGPEGNYLGQFGHYFSNRYCTPWGDALNFDGRRSDEVRRYFIENALQWFCDFHIDGLRLDAVHAIFDQSARPFLRELAEITHELAELQNRRLLLIAESNLNDPKLVLPSEVGGFGLDAQWVDDFHHALHVTLTSERSGYYSDYRGLPDLITSLRQGYVFTGQESRYRGRRHGVASPLLKAQHVVVAAQNHDQIGNRATGDRLTTMLNFEQLKLAAGIVLLAPFVPLLFMGEEYGETAPFAYFVSHSDERLIRAVREGRKRDFAHFDWAVEPLDAQDEETFRRCVLNHELAASGQHAMLWRLYRDLIQLRLTHPAMSLRSSALYDVLDWSDRGCFTLHYRTESGSLIAAFNVSDRAAEVPLPDYSDEWQQVIDSASAEWGGTHEARSQPQTDGRLSLHPQSFLVCATTRCDARRLGILPDRSATASTHANDAG